MSTPTQSFTYLPTTFAPLFIILALTFLTIPLACVLVATLYARPHHPSHYVPDDAPPEGGDPMAHNGRPSHPCLWAEAFPDQRGHHGLVLGSGRGRTLSLSKSVEGLRRVSGELGGELMERRRRGRRGTELGEGEGRDVEVGEVVGGGEV